MERTAASRLIKTNWIHILVWISMLVYVAVAPDVYARFILKEGKPVQFDH